MDRSTAREPVFRARGTARPSSPHALIALAGAWALASWGLQFVLAGNYTEEVAANLVELASPVIAFVACRRAGRRGAGAAWRWLAAACACWSIGSVAWTVYVVIEPNELPFPSFADAGFLAFYLPALIGVALLHDGPPRMADLMRTLLDAALVAGALTVVLWFAILDAASRGSDAFAAGLASGYVIGDIVVVSLAISAFRRSSGRRPDLLALIISLAALTVGDALFAYQAPRGTYGWAWLPDLGWITAFTGIAYAAHHAVRPRGRSTPCKGEGSEIARSLALFGPYFGAVALSGFKLVRHGELDRALGWTTIALAVIAFVRQVLAQAERHELNQHLRRRVDDLTSSEARFFTVFDESFDAQVLLAPEGGALRASRRMLELLGCTREELADRKLADVVVADDLRAAMTAFSAVRRGEPTASVTVRVRTPLGIRHVEVALTDLTANPAVGAVLLGCRDVTERVRQDEELAASQSRFRAAFDQAPIGMVVVDPDGTVNRMNAAMLAMLDLDGDPATPGHEEHGDLATPSGPRFAELAHEDDRPVLERVSVPVQDEHAVVREEVRLRRADGREVWAVISAVTVAPAGEAAYVIAQVEDVTERRRIAKTLEHHAGHDPLTDLPNRSLFLKRLADALAERPDHPAIAVAFVDLDRFKFVNDSLGHDHGDRLLCAVADRLRASSRAGDVISRFGGDEFTVLFYDVHDAATAIEVGRRVEQLLRKPFHLGGVETFVSASVGVAHAHALPPRIAPESAAEHLVRDADTAMYRAKEAGRSRTELFDERLDRGPDRLDLANALHRALDRDELLLHYQPVIDAVTGGLYGYEALLRWERTPGRLVSPLEFIHLAEDTGLIVPIGDWVLHTACAQAAAWHAAGDPLCISVNLSPRQFDTSDLVARVAAAIDATGVDPDLLWLEITESALMRDSTSTITVLRDLRSLGVHLSVDDFGTGYSSLSYLKRFPVEALKIDRSFTDGLGTEPEDTAIVTAVVGLARALNLIAIAEGVETEGQLTQLRGLGCGRVQGFLLGRPEPAGALTARAHELIR